MFAMASELGNKNANWWLNDGFEITMAGVIAITNTTPTAFFVMTATFSAC